MFFEGLFFGLIAEVSNKNAGAFSVGLLFLVIVEISSEVSSLVVEATSLATLTSSVGDGDIEVSGHVGLLVLLKGIFSAFFIVKSDEANSLGFSGIGELQEVDRADGSAVLEELSNVLFLSVKG